jgi:hypothetical protein
MGRQLLCQAYHLEETDKTDEKFPVLEDNAVELRHLAEVGTALNSTQARAWCLCLFSCLGMLRITEVCNLRIMDIHIHIWPNSISVDLRVKCSVPRPCSVMPRCDFCVQVVLA